MSLHFSLEQAALLAVRECARCHKEKPTTDYHKTQSATGLHSWCKDCYNDWKWQRRHPGEIPGILNPRHKRKVQVGKRYGRWTVLAFSHAKGHRQNYKVACDCGTVRTAESSNLLCGLSASCGCVGREKNASRALPDHGAAKRSVFDNYKRRASARGLSFDLTFEQFVGIVAQPCAYCGDAGSNAYGRRAFRHSGVDRVDNTKGYEAGNVVPCCKYCNWSKKERELDDFLSWATRIADRAAEFKREYELAQSEAAQ